MSIVIKDLRMAYRQKVAVGGVSFEVQDSECFGLIGPNGAGKTTIVECTVGLNQKYTGEISVLGLNPKKDLKELTRLVSIQLQESFYQDKLKVKEICQLFFSFYKEPADYRELLIYFQLDQYENTFISRLSGGMKQRLSIVLALISKPKVMFLDELTTGLDPEARVAIWENLEKLKAAQNISIFLTTHYLEEAHRLCDRVAVVYNGKILALDKPRNLISKSGVGSRIIVSNYQEFAKLVKEIKKEFTTVAISEKDQSIIIKNYDECEKPLMRFFVDKGIKYNVNEPTLEEVYFKIIEEAKKQ